MKEEPLMSDENPNTVDLSGTKAEWRRLPTELRERLMGEDLSRLRQLWQSIATDAELFMPPIRLEPYAWANKTTGDVFFGREAPVDMYGDGNWCFGVHLPAATVVVLDDLILRQIRKVRIGTLLTKRTSSEKRGSGREQKDRLDYRMCQGRVCPSSQQRP
jgi:hypothetical protein